MRARKLITLIAALALALVALPAAAQAADRDGDGMSDAWERSQRVGSAFADVDRDGVDNRNEYVEGTRARDRDSDDDGVRDGREDRDGDRLTNAAEDATGNNPRDRDSDNDGIPDGQEQAGVVTAYSDGNLTIELATGGSVTARVTERTDVDCATEATAEGNTQAQSSHRRGPVEDAAGEGGRGGFGCDGGREGRDSVECPEGTLKVGAKIHEATLRATSSGAEWREIEVLVPAS
jgi:Bacterial TSP3 repeat